MRLGVDHITNWIFVTGVPRSGTTFVGKVLSVPLEVDYIHEPFNPGCGMPGMERRYLYVRPSLDTPEMQRFHDRARRLFTYDFTLQSAVAERDSWVRSWAKRLVGSRGPFYLRLAKLNVFHRAAVVKDPTAGLLARYLYACFGMRPVIVVRHPVALAASLRRLGWHPSLHWLADQDALVTDYFADEREWLAAPYDDPVAASAAHWRAVYKVLFAQAAAHPEWPVVTHEALSRDPQGTFEALYRALDLPWSAGVERAVTKWTRADGAVEARRGRVQDFRRDSARLFEARRNQLSPGERRRVFEIVKDVALAVYSEESFDL